MKKEEKSIGVHIQTEVQFYAIEPVLQELKKYPYKTTILIERHEDDVEGQKEKARGVTQLMKEHGFSVEYSEDNEKTIFDLGLTPYMDGRVKAKCYLKYEYGSLNTKPALTYIPSITAGFHGLLCPSTDGVNMLACYGRTFPVDNLRFLGKKKRRNTKNRKIVLFAPTYNDEYDAEDNARIIAQLKKHYYVIVKAHHGIKYLKINKNKKEMLQKGPDEYYGSEISIVDLLMRADVCLANCSSVIGDAMRADVPCAVYTKDIDAFRWKDFHSTQYDLYKSGKLLVCNNPDRIVETINQALEKKYIHNWRKVSDSFFPKEYRTGVKGYMDVIDYYLNDPVAKKAVMLQDYYSSYWRDEIKLRENVIDEMDNYIKVLEQTRDNLTEALKAYSQSRIYRVAGKIYRVSKKFIKK